MSTYQNGSFYALTEAVQDLLGEAQGTAGGDNPFAYARLLRAEVDSLAQGTYCYHASFTLSITAGQADYCAPPVFYITAVLFTDASGTQTRLRECSREFIDGVYGTLYGHDGDGWRADMTPGTPTVYVSMGTNSVRLYPTPDTDITVTAGTTGGLTIEGYAAPGEAWWPDANFPDDPLAAVCPLPERAYETVINGAALRRIKQFPNQENAARAPLVQDDYRRGRGRLEREAATLTRDRR